MEDFYNILELDPSSSNQEIKEAYRKLSKKLHPDVDPGNSELEEKFKALQVAYSVLKDPIKKKAYDTRLEAHKNYLEQIKTYARNINPIHSKNKPDYIKQEKKNDVSLLWLLKNRIKKKDAYQLGAGILILFIIFSVIIFLERKFYNGAQYLETTTEPVPTTPLDSMEYIKGYNDSLSIKTEASSIKNK